MSVKAIGEIVKRTSGEEAWRSALPGQPGVYVYIRQVVDFNTIDSIKRMEAIVKEFAPNLELRDELLEAYRSRLSLGLSEAPVPHGIANASQESKVGR